MKVAIEAQRLLRSKRYGMDIVALELLKAFSSLNSDNEYTILSSKGDNKSNLPLDNPHFSLKEWGAKVYPIWEQFSLPQELDHGAYNVAHFTANTAPLHTTLPTVVTLHDIIFLDPLYSKKGGSYYQKMGNYYRKYLIPSC